jgi:hypothetical protein
MKPLFCSLLLLLIAASSFTQNSGWQKAAITPYLDLRTLKDTNITRQFEQLKREQLPNSGMPNAITIQPQPPVYLGNNGNGSDIYQSPIDNMPILMYDSSFASNMPVLKLAPDYGTGNKNRLNKTYPEFIKPEVPYRNKWQNKPFNLPK